MKERFLKDLEKRLAILSEAERQDIVNEYRDIIEEKIKHGTREADAIKEFGSVQELTKEILKAYKIDPSYIKDEPKDKTKDVLQTGEEWIKKGAEKLTEITDEVVNSFKNMNLDFSTNSIFELIIKIMLVLICLAILKIPFYIVSHIGSGILSYSFYPMNSLSEFIWKLLLEGIYIVVCVLLIMSIVKNHTTQSKNSNVKKNIKNATKVKETKKEPEKKVVKTNDKNTKDPIGNFLLTIIKIWCVILFLLPLWLIEIGMVISICIIIYILIKGVEIYGLLILMIGILGLTTYFTNLIWKLLFQKGKIHVYPIFMHIIFITVGGIMMFDYVSSMTYKNTLPSGYKEVSQNYIETLNQTIEAPYNSTIIIDDQLEDNQIKLEVFYFPDILILKEAKIEEGYIKIHVDYKEISFKDHFSNRILKDIKNKEIYNYRLLEQVRVNIYTNQNTKNLIK